MQLFDSHCHLDLIQSVQNCSQLQQLKFLESLKQQDITDIFLPSTHGHSSTLAEQLAHLSKQSSITNIYLSFGVHPWFLDEATRIIDINFAANKFAETEDYSQHLSNLLDGLFIEKPPAFYKAIGECGLDKAFLKKQKNPNINKAFKHQEAWFRAHCKLAKKHQLPMILHLVKANDEMLRIVKEEGVEHAVIHGFSGNYQQAKTWLDLGFHIGIGGTITYERARKTREAIKAIPIDRILLETDSPSMPTKGHQGKENTPQNIIHVITAFEEITGMPAEKIAENNARQCRAFFNL